jgi:UDP-N-acetylmuramate dehydrogenase
LKFNINIEANKNLSSFTSWLIGGQADFYFAPQSIEELKIAIKDSHVNKLPITILGGGTNVLISDKGIRGLVIHTHKLNKVKLISENEQVLIECEPGAPKAEVLKIFLKLRLEPAIFLAGLPGDMAGGVVMNAGVGHQVHPREFHEIIDSFEVLKINESGSIEVKKYQNTEIDWQYRKSYNWQPGVISKIWVKWSNKKNDQVLDLVREGNKRRKSTQPLSEPSCGSVFKNPEGDHAGRLIEASGLKAYAIGGAQVSEKHANFIVNKGQAKAEDVKNLIEYIQKTVSEKFKIKLTNEVVYLGEW